MRAGALLALLLAGCAAEQMATTLPSGVDPSDPRVDLCRRDAEASPAVRAIAVRRPLDTGGQRQRERELNAAFATEFDRCLRREGVRTRGGVQRIER